jgi:hypothetical protein
MAATMKRSWIDLWLWREDGSIGVWGEVVKKGWDVVVRIAVLLVILSSKLWFVKGWKG